VSSSRTSSTVERHRVLIADDEADSRELLRTVLESAGYQVAVVHDGSELYDVLTMSPAGHFRVVVADHHMPRMRGVDVLAHTSARTRFIILTGGGAPDLEDAAARLGASAFLRKPVDVIALLKVVRHVAVTEALPARPSKAGSGE
jgi:CheY-like chemotaxis protein